MLKEKIVSKSAQVGVIGLGYVGLPLACLFHEAGYHVLGYDISKERVDAVNRRESYIGDVPDRMLTFPATISKDTLGDMDIILLCVPTPLKPNKEPDTSYIERETEEIARRAGNEILIILESTTYPGTVRGVMLPMLGTRWGEQRLYLAHVPERIDPGNSIASIKSIPKIVGGIDDESRDLACLLYKSIADTVVPVSSIEVAEMTKVFENTFRHVNIALVNEMVELCRKVGVSIWEVVEAASTKPFGYMPFYPGVGVGGHCISTDPEFLAARAKEHDLRVRFIETASAVNERMPYYVANRIHGLLDSLREQKILVLGVSYKKNVADARESPSIKLMRILDERGAKVTFHDPLVEKVEWENNVRDRVRDLEEGLRWADLTVIAVDHDEYDWEEVVRKSKKVFDCKGVTKKASNVEVL